MSKKRRGNFLEQHIAASEQLAAREDPVGVTTNKMKVRQSLESTELREEVLISAD